jgi:hypothetical protein
VVRRGTLDTDWGGETLFYDDAGDAQLAVSPKPDGLLLFDGAIRHAGKTAEPQLHCGSLHLRDKTASGLASP